MTTTFQACLCLCKVLYKHYHYLFIIKQCNFLYFPICSRFNYFCLLSINSLRSTLIIITRALFMITFQFHVIEVQQQPILGFFFLIIDRIMKIERGRYTIDNIDVVYLLYVVLLLLDLVVVVVVVVFVVVTMK